MHPSAHEAARLLWTCRESGGVIDALPEALRLRRPEHPFKGLTHFSREDAAIFFGRHREIAEIIDAFKKGRHFLRLFGPTGTGKSSLLFAGLMPRRA